jgi:hypothetical protein
MPTNRAATQKLNGMLRQDLHLTSLRTCLITSSEKRLENGTSRVTEWLARAGPKARTNVNHGSMVGGRGVGIFTRSISIPRLRLTGRMWRREKRLHPPKTSDFNLGRGPPARARVLVRAFARACEGASLQSWPLLSFVDHTLF